MAKNGVEAVGSMGNDTPLAALSDRPRLLYDYFKQLFAQVTNPPIDCIREELITASEVWLGSEGNLLRPQPADCRRLELKGPILTNEEFAKVRRVALPGLKVGTLSILFRATRGEKGLTKSVEELCLAARRLIEDEEVNILILSDRGVSREFAAVPALLAVSAVHHYLIHQGLRTRVSLALETGEAREVHHFALLIGFGCSVVNPYLAFETLEGMIHEGLVTNVDAKLACKNFIKAATKGVIKVMSKMGISAIQSYHGAQVFEAVGLRQDIIDQYFTWTASRIGGIGMETIAQEVLLRHRAAFPDARDQRPHARGGRNVPVAGRRRASPVQPGIHPSAAEGRAQRQLCHLQVVREADRRAVEDARNPAGTAGVRRVRAACRWRKSSRSRASSSASRPAPCPMARSARKRTRRSRSP